MPTLFDLIDLGRRRVSNRIFFAFMIRGRATPEEIPLPHMAD